MGEGADRPGPGAAEGKPDKASRILGWAPLLLTLLAFLAGSGVEGLTHTWHYVFESNADRHSEKVSSRMKEELALITPLLGSLSAGEPGRNAAVVATMQAIATAHREPGDGDDPDPIQDYIQAVANNLSGQGQRQPTTPDDVVKSLADKPPETAAPAPAAAASGALSGALGQGAEWRNAVVYIQADKQAPAAVATANDLSHALNSKGIFSPGVQRMPSDTIPKWTQVRYFNDGDKAAAESLARVVSARLQRPVATAQPKLPAKEGTLEIWLGKDEAAAAP
jgi:hypothetical protein